MAKKKEYEAVPNLFSGTEDGEWIGKAIAKSDDDNEKKRKRSEREKAYRQKRKEEAEKKAREREIRYDDALEVLYGGALDFGEEHKKNIDMSREKAREEFIKYNTNPPKKSRKRANESFIRQIVKEVVYEHIRRTKKPLY